MGKKKKHKAVGARQPAETISWTKIKKDMLKRKFGMLQDNNLEEKRRKKKARRAEKLNSTPNPFLPAEEKIV